MKLRSRPSSSSNKGESSRQYQDSSDEDDVLSMSLDSDDYGSSDEDEADEVINLLNEGQTSGVLDSDYVTEEVWSEITKRRKLGSYRKKGQKSIKIKEEQVEEEEHADWMNEVGGGGEVDTGYLLLMGRIEDRKKSRDKSKKKRGATLMWEIWEEENDRWMAENYTNDLDLNGQNELVTETVEPPSDLIMPLLRYQKEWLAWALKQEESTARGGILADEMGMGKTVQAIALVLAQRELGQAISDSRLLSPAPCTSQELPAVKGTLVICPVVAVIQWVSEIDRFTTKGSNKILVYHGANREKNIDKFAEYDFVITTYSTVEAEYRKNVMPPKQKCQWCGKSFYEQKLSVHQKYFCGPDAVKTANQSKQQSKKPKPVGKTSKLKKDYSDSEIDTGKRGRGKGKKRKSETDAGSIDDSASVGQDMSTKKSILHSVKWNRIILDEAHYVKDRRSNTTRAILALESSYKWALSGTPLQNRVGELYSLVRFLQMIPYSYYFCKDCDCRVLDYSSSECPHCPHKSVRHFCWWNRYIASPIQAQGNHRTGRDAMVLLKHKILKSILLRRTKKGRAADLALPPRIVTLRKDSLDVKEEDYYTSLYNESQAQFNTYIQAGTLMNNYAHIFDLLTRLRQAVDHPYLVVYSSTALARNGHINDAGYVEQPCGLCHDPVEDPVVTSCTHVFCKSCLINFSASVGQVSCPSCSKPLTVDFTANDKGDQKSKATIKGFRSSSILNRICLDDFQTSTKIDALREEIRFMVERDGSAKAIVFSQFTSFLDLIHYSLQKSGISCVQLDGSMTMAARDNAITRFTEDPDCRIFLMSLKAGGVALNLTVASHVFLMDPWWNPAVERQAQDRIHRIGQYKPIRVVRFVIENTIEERILKLQEKKELVFEGTVGGCSEALGKLTEADLKFLFVT
ncbi:DNA repair protein RAD16-like isoform X2 [Lycium ferocissimum]|uniref:DNA repair protein RAD16-like isoform X2 n=1 Tax=Lycium ferocissimum TaxID=112874 RepID=UPI00281583CA|nr:DNA repair protein RAD16-like isoform X2 [Lycium ferocissimum]